MYIYIYIFGNIYIYIIWAQSLMLYLTLTFLDTLNLVNSMGECLNE